METRWHIVDAASRQDTQNAATILGDSMKVLSVFCVSSLLAVSASTWANGTAPAVEAQPPEAEVSVEEAKRKAKVKKEAKRLAAKDKGEPRICSRQKVRTGSRLRKVRCRTKTQIERDNQAHRDVYRSNSSQFKRAPMCSGCRKQ